MRNSNTPGASPRRSPLVAGIVVASLGLAGLSYANIDIVFDYSFDTNNFFADQTRRNILEDVAGFFETHITDDLLAIDSAGGNSFNVGFFNPGTGATEVINNFDVAADTLVIFVGGRELGGSTLGQGGPGGFSVSGSSTFVNNAITRGETPTTDGVRGSTATDFAPWGGAVTFDVSTNWYFDTDTSTTEAFSGSDFYSVALHEVAHVLGYGTSDSWDNLVINGSFTGDNAVAENGGNVPLAGADTAHWRAGTRSTIFGTTTNQEAAMDPSITVGTRKRMTDLDMAGLADIGWEVAAASAQ